MTHSELRTDILIAPLIYWKPLKHAVNILSVQFIPALCFLTRWNGVLPKLGQANVLQRVIFSLTILVDLRLGEILKLLAGLCIFFLFDNLLSCCICPDSLTNFRRQHSVLFKLFGIKVIICNYQVRVVLLESLKVKQVRVICKRINVCICWVFQQLQ